MRNSVYKSFGAVTEADTSLHCREFTADDVLTTANALQSSKLQFLSVACGRVRIPKAYANVTLSVSGCAVQNSTECQQTSQLANNTSKSCLCDL